LNNLDTNDKQRKAEDLASTLGEADPILKSLKRKLAVQTEKPLLAKYRIKSIIAVKDSGLPLFHVDLEKQETSAETTNRLAGLTSALHSFASEAVQQEIQELSLEDDKVFFLQEKETEAIIGVVAEKTVPSSILKRITIEICELLVSSEILKSKHVELTETARLSEAVQKIVQKHALRQTDARKFLLKVVLLGDGGVGKTSLFNRFMGKGFKANYLMTIGADFGVKNYNLQDSGEVKFLVTDVAGQQHFKEVRKAFYQGTSGALIVVDVTRPETFQNSIHWLNEAWTHGPGPFPVIFLGNKNDLRSQVPESVSHDRIRVLADVLSKESQRTKGFLVPYLPTSAKTGLNVDLAFETLGKEIVQWLLEHRQQRALGKQQA
jgi:small GTP-binding protein